MNLLVRARHGNVLHAMLVFGILTITCILICAVPHSAQAKDYSIPKVDIDATVEQDGTLEVTEVRTFDFKDSFSYCYWDLSLAGPNNTTCTIDVLEAGEYSGGSFKAFTERASGGAGTYDIDSRRNKGTPIERVTLHFSKNHEKASFYVKYRIHGDVTAWSDCGELYWKYVSDGWQVASNDVTCTVHLPVPAGAQVTPGENVRAWQHHKTLTGEVQFNGNDVVGTIPRVNSEDFAELRITFPVEWLTVTPKSTGALDKIMSEEKGWAESANAARDSANALSFGGCGVLSLAGIAIAIWGIFAFRRYKANHKANFDDHYWRDVPSDDHPAVLEYVWDGTAGDPEAMVATLMDLTDRKIVTVERANITKSTFFGKEVTKEEYRLRLLVNDLSQVTNPIDRATLDFFFGWLPSLIPDYAQTHEPYTIYFSDMQEVANKHRKAYKEQIDAWNAIVKAQCVERGIDTDPTGGGGKGVVVVALILLIIALTAVPMMAAFLDTLSMPILIGTGILVIGCIVAMVMGGRMRSISPEALEIRAKLEGLRNWFKDFTALDESVPQDVIVWNKLLVMAVILNVAKEVIENLKIAAPNVYNNPGFYHSVLWCSSYGNMSSPLSAFSNSYSSSYSSASGSGGGSSGGGSGGGGGGGGGGAG